MRCQICYSNDTKICAKILSKTYWECKTCFAKFLDVSHYLSAKDEYAHYCTHQNEIYDPRYRKFLSKLVIPLKRVLTNQKFGLDYGCGPGPALSIMLDECGFEMSKYDPFFFPDNKILSKKFDFITSSETVEHFFNPNAEFIRLDKMLKTNGIIAIMTNFLTEDLNFEDWYYRKDPTHVVFYSKTTFETISKQRGWKVHFPATNVVFFEKSDL